MTTSVEPLGDVMATLLARLALLRDATARAGTRTPATATALLVARARALAAPLRAETGMDVAGIEALVFRVGEERFAMPLASIVAIGRVGSVAPLPRAVRPVYGVSAWRGRPLTVLSLASGRPTLDVEARLLVLGVGARARLAVIVDAVDEVRRFASDELSPAGPGPRAHLALGITTDGLLLVDGNALLHTETPSG